MVSASGPPGCASQSPHAPPAPCVRVADAALIVMVVSTSSWSIVSGHQDLPTGGQQRLPIHGHPVTARWWHLRTWAPSNMRHHGGSRAGAGPPEHRESRARRRGSDHASADAFGASIARHIQRSPVTVACWRGRHRPTAHRVTWRALGDAVGRVRDQVYARGATELSRPTMRRVRGRVISDNPTRHDNADRPQRERPTRNRSAHPDHRRWFWSSGD